MNKHYFNKLTVFLLLVLIPACNRPADSGASAKKLDEPKRVVIDERGEVHPSVVKQDLEPDHIDILPPPSASINVMDQLHENYAHWTFGSDQLDFNDKIVEGRAKYWIEKFGFTLKKARSLSERDVFISKEERVNVNYYKGLFRGVYYGLAFAYHWKPSGEVTNPYYHSEEIKGYYLDFVKKIFASGAFSDETFKPKWGTGKDDFFEKGYFQLGGTALLNVAPFCHAAVLMKDELREEGMLEEMVDCLNEFTYYIEPVEGGRKSDSMPGLNADIIKTTLLNRLCYIMLLDEGNEIIEPNLTDLSQLIERSLMISQGFADLIKPDYLGFHHKMLYGSAYSTETFACAAAMTSLFKGTSYVVSETALSNLINACLTTRVYGHKYDVPRSTNGRFPNGVRALPKIAPALAQLSELTKDSAMKHKCIGAAKRLWDSEDELLQGIMIKSAGPTIGFYHTFGQLESIQRVVNSSVSAEAPLDGNWYYPYGGLMIHRRPDWMVSIRSYSRYVSDFETGSDQNLYGRNLNSGALEFMNWGDPYPTVEENGYIDKGWDWNHIPGTTTLYLPLDKFPERKKARDFGKDTFVGGLTDGGNGIYVASYTDRFSTLRAKKSYFFKDNLIICLGSNITGEDKLPVHTALFQNAEVASAEPVKVNQRVINKDAFSEHISRGSTLIYDGLGRYYYLPDTRNLTIERKIQQSASNNGKKSEGVFSSAYIDHGVAPKKQNYHYSVVVNNEHLDNAQLKSVFSDYKILKQNEKAHIVSFANQHRTAYVVFDGEDLNDALVKSTSRSLLLDATVQGERMKLIVNDPNFGWFDKTYKFKELKHGEDTFYPESETRPAQFELNGKWKLDDRSGAVRVISSTPSLTRFEVDCIGARSIEINLIKD